MAKKQISISVEPRTETGSAASRRLRRDGRVPCIVYGRGFDSTQVTMDALDLKQVVHHSGVMALAGSDLGDVNVLVRDVQWNHLHTEVQHIDFQIVRMDEKIATTVPIEVIGTPKGVHEGGVLEQLRHDIEVEALPADLPEEITIDVSGLGMNDVLTIADVAFPEGVSATEDAERVLFTIVLPREEEEEAEEEEGILGEEPQEPELIGKEEKEEVPEEEG